MNRLSRAWKLLATFAVYALVLGILMGLSVRSPKFILTLLGIGFLISALFWDVLGGLILGGLTALLALPFLPAESSSLTWAAGFGLSALVVGGGIGWINRAERKHPQQKRARLYPAEIFQRALNPMLIVDPSGRVMERNDRAVELLGSVKHLSEFIHIDDLDRARAELEHAVSVGEANGLELRAVSWDKETLPAEIRMRKLSAEQVWVEVRDLSDRFELERRLWETEARYRYLIEDAIDTLDTGIVLLDRDKQVIWANQTIGYLFNLDRDELIGVNLRRVLTQMQPQMPDAGAFDRVLAAGEESFVFTLRQGCEERILEFRSLPIETERYQGGRIDHYIDLTELKKLERELVEKTKRMEESNKKLEEFSHVVSHDLKQPLRTIQAFSQFLIEDYREKLDEQGMSYLLSLQRSSMRMKNLIDDLLKLASIGTKREPLESVGVKDVLTEVHEDLGALLDGVDLTCPPDFPVVVANRTRMAELFANLVSNAVKYNDKPNKHVAIGWEEQPDEYLFYVRDNGMGIEERYQDRVFELFERLNPRDDPESTGAGLAICKRIVNEIGGRIWVESELGRGSTFYFSVPKRSRVLAHQST
ncbi:MAG: hypothetical protein A2Z21_00750 [Candidatus Fraserbacteria bacterium RBG_16_55_9]|uniref:histidine kinase n=1 Tax=Fraserbacteria sp. (strain RBG_16_55_9) TaxID=1817864 RepID=A0A1F5UZ16_FRAXR|nr:MAG: hypothetical protein A2Z21_00750 [Candidatus Fraserbacteria bacterium RBG_16_55_9]